MYYSKKFNKIAKTYNDSIALVNSLDDWVYLKNLSKKRDKVLDIGCGTGHLLLKLKKFYKECYDLDISSEMLSIAKEKDPEFKLICGSAEDLPYKDEYFDMVVSHTTFHHLDQSKALEEAIRVLKKGGKFVLVDVSKRNNQNKKQLNNIILSLRLVKDYDPLKAPGIIRSLLKNEEWKKHMKSENHLYFTKEKFDKFFSKNLPDAKLGSATYTLAYVVWEKDL